MENSKTLDILKTGILLEKRGKAFYANCAEQATNPDLKRIFEILSEEEDEHIRFLSEQYISYRNTKQFSAKDLIVTDQTEENTVLIERIIAKTSSSGYEASAVAAALDMENRAIAVYSEQAKIATDPEEKKFYEWLANWERGHHKLLYEIDKELQEKIWFDSNFWPF